MSRQKRVERDLPKEQEEESRLKKKAQQPVYDELKARNEGVADSLADSSFDRHGALLAEAHSDEQRASLMTDLQQSHGNAYVQQLIGRIQAEKGLGLPLGSQFRAQMEASFREDFSGVRVHTDAKADQLAQELGADAFTTGKDIFFRKDVYQPGSEAGKKSLGHELTHVVQQSGDTASAWRITEPEESVESEAKATAQALGEGKHVSVESKAGMGAIARQGGGRIIGEVRRTKPKEEEGEGGGVRLEALKAMFEAAVVQPIENAFKALNKKEPDIKDAYNNVHVAVGVILRMRPAYKGVEPMQSRLMLLGQTLYVIANSLGAHLNITIPLEEIRDVLDPGGKTMQKYLDFVRIEF